MNPSDKQTGKRIKNNLVALGSAAVFTVYAAGFMRTREAAERFAGEDAERRPAIPMGQIVQGPAATLDPRISATSVPAGPASSSDGDGSKARAGAAPTPASSASPTADSRTNGQSGATSASQPAAGAAVSNVPSAPPAVPAGSSVPTSDSTSTGTSGAAGQTANTAAPVAPKAPALKDGVYLGWGSTRHGQIEAAVEIRHGRIISASITQCLMHYSCSWISMLPDQVVARQSPEVDYISGATQSTNSFYYAVVDALSKAK